MAIWTVLTGTSREFRNVTATFSPVNFIIRMNFMIQLHVDCTESLPSGGVCTCTCHHMEWHWRGTRRRDSRRKRRRERRGKGRRKWRTKREDRREEMRERRRERRREWSKKTRRHKGRDRRRHDGLNVSITYTIHIMTTHSPCISATHTHTNIHTHTHTNTNTTISISITSSISRSHSPYHHITAPHRSCCHLTPLITIISFKRGRGSVSCLLRF